MAINRMPWFRLYSEILDDKKIKRICRATSFNKATVIGVWVTLLALANDSDDRGSLQISEGMPYEISDIAYETEMPDDQVETLLKLFEQYDMLHYDNKEGWSILNWDGRQFKSDNVSERVAKHRAKKAKEQVKRYSNVIDTDTDTDTDTESDTESEVNGKDALLDAFCEITGIPMPSNPSHFVKWDSEVSEWLHMGVTEKDIRQSYETAIGKDYTVARPQSLTNFIRGGIAKRTGKRAETVEEMKARLLGDEYQPANVVEVEA